MNNASIQAHTQASVVSDHNPAFDSPIQLGINLWFDAATATILRAGESYPLTAREVGLLTLLLMLPNRFQNATTLARLLKKRHLPLITAHSIEQTICGLRKKLGENGQSPSLLRNRRGLGYGLFLPTSAKPPHC